jgi:very-short-patch-repair endonuclease
MKYRQKARIPGVSDAERQAAADLRRLEPTPAEAQLARILGELGKGALAGEFRREWPVGDWVVDFWFPSLRLAIEVDGGYHRAQSRWRLDWQKTAWLEAQGITVLRLANAEVFGDRERLVGRLRDAWRVASRKSRAWPPVAREPAGAPYRVTPVCRATFSILQARPREFGEPLALSYGPA